MGLALVMPQSTQPLEGLNRKSLPSGYADKLRKSGQDL
jgi:hypothetical protein